MWILWVKAAHIVAVVAWFAGLLYLPRLFVYHAQCDDLLGQQRFGVMEQRLYRRIMGPALIATLVLGLVMMAPLYGAWLIPKLVLVALVVAFHISCGRHIKKLAANAGFSAKFYRYYNEIPIVLLIAIVLLVVLKPSLAMF